MKRTAILILLLPATLWAATAVMTSFRRGEISPRLYGRTDTLEFYSGSRVCENFFVKPHGPVEKRPGTYYIADAAGTGRLIGFEVSTGDALVLELTAESIRFFK